MPCVLQRTGLDDTGRHLGCTVDSLDLQSLASISPFPGVLGQLRAVTWWMEMGDAWKRGESEIQVVCFFSKRAFFLCLSSWCKIGCLVGSKPVVCWTTLHIVHSFALGKCVKAFAKRLWPRYWFHHWKTNEKPDKAGGSNLEQLKKVFVFF